MRGFHGKGLGPEAKKAVYGRLGLFGEGGKLDISGLRDGGGSMDGERWFVALTSMGGGGKVRGICFDHEAICGNLGGGVETGGGILKGRDAGEREESAEGENGLGEFERTGKAMEDGRNLFVKLSVDRQSIVEGGLARAIADVNDDVEAELGGEGEVAAEKVALAGMVVLFAPALRGGMEVIEARFSDRGDFGVGEKGAKLVLETVRGFVDVTRVDP